MLRSGRDVRVGRVCASGGTPAFSYDERWIALHHYLGDGDDGDAVERGFTGADVEHVVASDAALLLESP